MIERLEQRIAIFQKHLREIPVHDNARDVGSLFASRHCVSNDGYILDWSLTKLDQRSLTNKVPEEIYKAKSTKELRNTEPTSNLTTWSAERDIIRGCTVVKCGRTTGWTVGTVNEFETVTLVSREGKEFKGKAWKILSDKIQAGGISRAPFMEKGDSGCIIIRTEPGLSRESGVMVGLGFGVIQNFGLMTPLSVVFTDIENEGVGSIVEPRKIEAYICRVTHSHAEWERIGALARHIQYKFIDSIS